MAMDLDVTLLWNPIFRTVNSNRSRYRLLKGSAGSGKSLNIAQDYIKKLSDPKYKGANLLVCRKADVTNKHSTFAELRSAIYRTFGDLWDQVWEIRLSPMELRCKITGNQIIFRGMKDDKEREKIKSVNFERGKLTFIWLEEATEFLEADIDILDDRLRGRLDNPNLYYQITFSFNPVSATHWIKKKYFDTPSNEVFTHHSTYLDNRFIDEAYHNRMMRRKQEDPEGYKVYGEGQWGELSGLILNNYTVYEFDTSYNKFDTMHHAQDFGYNHANCILTLGFKDGNQLFICNEIYVHERDTTEIIHLADSHGVDKRLMMYCDSSEPDRIQMWNKAGYRAKAVVKNPGSIKAQIDILKKYTIHIHPSCINTIKEIQQWKWKKDTRTNQYIDHPVEVFDDAMAALRYGIEPFRVPIPEPRIRFL